MVTETKKKESKEFVKSLSVELYCLKNGIQDDFTSLTLDRREVLYCIGVSKIVRLFCGKKL